MTKNDQCRHCDCFGNLGYCLKTDCSYHENWYAVEQQKKIDYLERKVTELLDIVNTMSKHLDEKEQTINKLTKMTEKLLKKY